MRTFAERVVRIKHARDICDLAVIDSVGIGVQAKIGMVSDMYFAEIILIDITKHPNLREIGDGEQVRTVVETLDPLEPRNVLLNNSSGESEHECQSANWDELDLHPVVRTCCSAFCTSTMRFLFRILGLLQVFFCERTMRVEQLCPVQRLFR